MYWEIHPPRTERLPEGNLEGREVQNPRPREISRSDSEGDVLYSKCILTC